MGGWGVGGEGGRQREEGWLGVMMMMMTARG